MPSSRNLSSVLAMLALPGCLMPAYELSRWLGIPPGYLMFVAFVTWILLNYFQGEAEREEKEEQGRQRWSDRQKLEEKWKETLHYETHPETVPPWKR